MLQILINFWERFADDNDLLWFKGIGVLVCFLLTAWIEGH